MVYPREAPSETSECMFDGDTLAIYTIHSKAALKQAESFAHIKNTIQYDSDETSYLSLIRHEALYAAFILSKDFNHIDTTKIIKLDKLQDLQENIELYNTPNACVEVDNNYYTVGICLFNKWCGFNTIVINCLINKKNNNFVSDQIYKYFNSDSELYYKNLNNLEKNLFFYISVTNVHPPTINIGQMSSVVDAGTQLLFDKIPKNVDLGYLVNQALIDRCLIKLDETNNTLNSLYRSGSRFSDKQLSRSCINIGFCADAKNLVAADPINTNLLRGLSEKEFFSSSSGTRKGIYHMPLYIVMYNVKSCKFDEDPIWTISSRYIKDIYVTTIPQGSTLKRAEA